MRFLLFLSVLPFLATAAPETTPQEKPAAEAEGKVAKPFLWKVEGNGLKQPSWLFGTIHLGGKAVSKLHPAAEKAFGSADIVYTEIPMDVATQMQAAMSVLRADGKTLSASIGEKLADEVKAELKAINPDLNLVPFEFMKTWAIAVTLPLLKSQLGGEQALDDLLAKRAASANKKTDALETAKSQTDIFDTLKEEEQVILLGETLRRLREDREKKEDSLETLRGYYLAGDAEKMWKLAEEQLADLGEHKDLADRLVKKLLTDRNQAMAETMGKHLAEAPDKTHFFAVGTAHYLGPQSICGWLEKKGFKVTRVTE